MTNRLMIEKKHMPLWNFKMKGIEKKPAKGMMHAFLTGSWMMVALWTVVSVLLLKYHIGWGCLMMFCTIAFGWYLSEINTQMRVFDCSKFELKANDDLISFTTIAPKVHQEQIMLWKNLKWVEIYSYIDNTNLVLQGKEKTIEIPLWAFGRQAELFLRILNAKQLPILRIP